MKYVRVRDKATKHEYDLPETHPAIKRGSVERVKDDRYPPSPVARPAKHYVKPAGQSAAASTEKEK